MNEEALMRIAEAKLIGAEELDLADLDLDVLPEQLRELRQLRWLDLSSTRLTHLPKWLAELRLLEYIDLSQRYLIIWGSLPDCSTSMFGRISSPCYLIAWVDCPNYCGSMFGIINSQFYPIV